MAKQTLMSLMSLRLVKKMAVFIQNQTFDEGWFWTKSNFLYCYRQDGNNRLNCGKYARKYTGNMQDLIWRTARFDLIDDEDRLPGFRFTKQDIIH